MRWLAIALLSAATTTARADDAIVASAGEPPPPRHLVYVEALGKGGLYGIGYEYAMTERLGVGAATSYSNLSEHQVFTMSPYLHAQIFNRGRHSLFAEVGGILAYSRIASPVENWDGMSEWGGGGFATLGWQYVRGPIVLRTSVGVAVGEGGGAPMTGIAFGVRP